MVNYNVRYSGIQYTGRIKFTFAQAPQALTKIQFGVSATMSTILALKVFVVCDNFHVCTYSKCLLTCMSMCVYVCVCAID